MKGYHRKKGIQLIYFKGLRSFQKYQSGTTCLKGNAFRMIWAKQPVWRELLLKDPIY